MTGVRRPEGAPSASLGLIMWNIFHNDLVLNVNKADLAMYADDRQLYSVWRNLGNVKETIERKGKLAAAWLE